MHIIDCTTVVFSNIYHTMCFSQESYIWGKRLELYEKQKSDTWFAASCLFPTPASPEYLDQNQKSNYLGRRTKEVHCKGVRDCKGREKKGWGEPGSPGHPWRKMRPWWWWRLNPTHRTGRGAWKKSNGRGPHRWEPPLLDSATRWRTLTASNRRPPRSTTPGTASCSMTGDSHGQ